MTPETDAQQSHDQMAIVEKYETVIAYLYPVAQNIGRRHGVAKAMFIECLLEQVKLIIEAGKSGQVSRLYIADAGLAQLRFWLRFLSSSQVRGLTHHQVETAQVTLGKALTKSHLLGATVKATMSADGLHPEEGHASQIAQAVVEAAKPTLLT